MGHDVSGQTALAVTTVTVTVDVGALNLWGPSRRGGGGYCDCAQVVLELWGRMIWKADCE